MNTKNSTNHLKNHAGFTISAAQQWCRRVVAKRQHPSYAGSDNRQAGFTIVELMIATLVFSMVLLVITYGVVHFTTDYYRGINNSTTQTATQNAIDSISQSIQFSAGGTTASDSTHFCAGGKVFMYDLGTEFTGTATSTNRGLYEQDADASCSDPGTPSGGTELLGKNMRVADVSVQSDDATDPTVPWQITLRIAYGDSDLLCSLALNGDTGGCDSSSSNFAATDNFAADDMLCRSQIGSQFCSVVVLNTIAQQRIVN
jgi:prepilin-type N-terminal cleavage/methylation domain-containing protein